MIKYTQMDIKEDEYINFGRLTAYLNGNIFFFADINGTKGIYSINESGGNAELVVSCDKISRLQVRKNEIWFTEFEEEIITKRKWKLPKYLLKKYSIDEKGKMEFLFNSIDSDVSISDYGIENFYCLDNESIVVCEYTQSIPRKEIACRSYIIKSGEKEKIQKIYNTPIYKGRKSNVETPINNLDMFRYDQLLMLEPNRLYQDQNSQREWNLYFPIRNTFFDANINKSILRETIWDDLDAVTLWKIEDNLCYLTHANNIYIYNSDTKQLERKIKAPEINYIDFLTVRDNHIYFCVREIGNETKNKTFCTDLETNKTTTLSELNSGRMVSFIDNCIIHLVDNELVQYSVKGDKLALEHKVKLKAPGFGKKYKAEQAGKMVFIYSCNLEEDELVGYYDVEAIELIYIKTK